MGLASIDPPQGAHRLEARARWNAKAIDSYYIAVRIEALGVDLAAFAEAAPAVASCVPMLLKR